MTTSAVRVIKLGGSLLDYAALAGKLRMWLARQPPATDVLIVGGGKAVEALRQLDAEMPLGDETAHDLAMAAMSLSAAWAAQRFGEMRLARDLQEIAAEGTAANRTCWLLDTYRFASELPADRLPRSWDVTSDSIAARVAEALGAFELVLLKSALPPEPCELESLAAGGYVDRYFPIAACEVARIRAVNLRSEDDAEAIIK